ncbi:cilia- and flagella-associated protein 61-like isoform X2 [Lineus longissimus]|uniref:cilia- and flagella-associated protein 61-like isoform X2 n=1 Tax=Lineus longissimus TaxID=88925 RepID=UPI00315D4EE1
MTTIETPDGPTEVINARRTESLDAPSIQGLVQPSTEALFGRVNVVNLIEKAVLAVTLSNEKEELLGHAALFDYPNLPSVDPAEWEGWLNSHYDCKKSTALNTMFLHYFVAKQEYSHGCAKEIIRTVFNAVPDTHYIYLIVPQGVFPDSAVSEIFKPMEKLGGSKGPDGCVVFVCKRHDHVPVLHIRQARVQDHDDLTPIFNRQSDMLRNTYGDYFLAELIEAQDEDMQCLVAEEISITETEHTTVVEGTAVGFMSICSEVNVNLLNECFELGPFHGLRKEHPDDVVIAPKTPSPSPPPEEEAQSSRQGSRPSSAGSAKSAGSKKSASSVREGSIPEGEAEKPARTSSAKSEKSTASKGSLQADDETVIRRRLSDEPMGSQASLLSEHGKDDGSDKSVSLPGSAKSEKRVESQASVLPTPKVITPHARLPKRFVPEYYGEANAFSIQLFCIDERFEMRSADFLNKAFELFPNLDFVIITVPHLVPEFPLLQQFVRVTPRTPSVLSQELYIFNKSGLIKNFDVRPACTKDLAGVEKLVQTIELHENLLDDLKQFNKMRRDSDGTEIQAFVAECLGQVVGIAIIRREEDIEFIRSHYNIEDFIYFNHHRRDEHGHLHHFALNPIFAHYSKYFLKEVLRLGHKTCLYYPVYPPYVDKQVLQKHSLVSALNDMVPVRSRRQITYPQNALGGNSPSERVLASPEPYALSHINRKLTLEPKVTINARIVVVGASDVGIGFLETFAFCPHLRFNNLTLISPHGLPGELPPDELRDSMLGSSLAYDQDDYTKISLRTWVNVVYGSMTAIDRNKKHVVVNDSTIVPFDHLILATGMQYHIPAPNEADISKLVTSNEAPYGPDRRFMGEVPKNVFTINDAYDAAVILYWIENNFLNKAGKALIYGNTLDAYCSIQALISMGVSGNRIIMVQPPLQQQTCFNNPDVETAVTDALKEAGVQIHQGYLLAEWNDGNGGPEVYSASFTSSTKPIRFECSAFFCYYRKAVDVQAFKSINNACLVYDGKLVIDANFHTNDVSIRGAGTLTKFQRKYHADQWTHANFNSKEVGMQLANTMLTLFDPTLEPEPEPPAELMKLIPMYRAPKMQAGILPGDFWYVHVCKPGLNTPLDTQMAQSDYGDEIITGSPNSNKDYFRLHINQYKSIETITCLSKKPLPTSNILCLYGLHERYLNNLMSRFGEGLVNDLYEFFGETWCLAIFHDRFADFREEIRELLLTRPAEDVPALEEKVRELIEDDLMLSKANRSRLTNDFKESGAKRAVETRLLSFLSYNYYHMPMYAKPGMV